MIRLLLGVTALAWGLSASAITWAAEGEAGNASVETEARVIVINVESEESPACEAGKDCADGCGSDATVEVAVADAIGGEAVVEVATSVAEDAGSDETAIEGAGQTAAAATAVSAADAVADNGTGAQPTHKQSMLVEINAEGLTEASVQCFCLDADANMLAGVSGGVNEIRVFDRDGALVRKIELPVAPEAINLAADGTILVAGGGKILRLDGTGAELVQVDAPHVTALLENEDQVREEVIEQHKQQLEYMPQLIEAYASAIEQLDQQLSGFEDEEKEVRQQVLDQIIDERLAQAQGADSDAAKQAAAKIEELSDSLASIAQRREALVNNREAYEQAQVQIQEQYGDGAEPEELTEEKIAELVKSSMQYKMAVASISGTADAVFIACHSSQGYTYDVWKLSTDLSEGECIVTGLSGCCGQMDVQACESGVYVAENSRHRVCRYDDTGELVGTWGEGARSGVEGFGSCCNPMNLAFGADGVVYTAEDTTGRIKRYSPEGQLLSVVGAAEVVPGCKKVAIGVSDGGDRVYMLDITRNHIAVLDRVLPDPTGPISDEANSTQTAGGGLLRLLGFGSD